MTTELQTERQGHTLVMRLNGPATRNALSPQVYAAGIELLNVAESNPDVRAVVLTGHGGHDRLDFRDDVPVPKPGADDVLIRVAAAGGLFAALAV